MINLLFLFLISSFLFPSTINAATFSFSPSTGSFGNGCQSSIDIRLDATGQSTNAADIIIDYNPSLVEIIDADTGSTGTQITTGSVYTNYFGNIVDTNTGVIRLTGASFNTFFTTSGVFGSIQFRPLTSSGTATFSIRFTGANPYNSLDSNIADSLTSNDLLSSVTNGSYTLTSTSCTSDNTAPNISHISPINGQTGVSASANIVTTITDNSSGVDQNSVEIIINGVTYRSGQSGVVVTGNSSSYTFTVTPAALLFTNQLNTILVNALDFAGNSKSSTITFNAPSSITPTPITSITPTRIPTFGPSPTYSPLATPLTCPTQITCPICSSISPTPIPESTNDHQSPFVEFIKPKAKDLIDLSPTLVIKVSDYDSGIDLNSLKIVFNNQIYNLNSTDLKYKGDLHSYEITLKTNQKLSDSSEYQLEVFIADNNQNGLSQTINLKTRTPLLNQINNTLNKNPLISQKNSQTTLAQLAASSFYFILLSLIPFLIYFVYHLLHSLQTDNKKPYGIIFNSKTLEPLSKIKVEVYSIDNRKVATYYSNIFGIFAGDLPSGKYRFIINSKYFKFPSEVDFNNLDHPKNYHGDLTEPTYLQIPIDPIAPYLQPRLPKYGITTPNTKIGLIETKFNTLVATRISDQLGQYRFIVPHGRYQLVHNHTNIGQPIDTRHRIDGYTVINYNIKLSK